MEQRVDTVIVGAGLAGLSCAAELGRAGRQVVLLDRSDRPGGRCASRQLGGETGVTVDFGPSFIHGRTREFKSVVENLGSGALLEGWPQGIHGEGTPCQPEAFSPGVWRYGLRNGIDFLPRTLAKGLPDTVTSHFGTTVEKIESTPQGWIISGSGSAWQAENLVLALAMEQTRSLVTPLGIPGLDGPLGLFGSLPCLTVAAVYGESSPLDEVPWDIWYPSGNSLLLMVSNEGSKRRGISSPIGQGPGALVLQARPAWSKEKFEDDRESWSQELLAVLAGTLGDWVRKPLVQQTHRWRYGRIAAGDHLEAPLAHKSAHGTRLIITGDLHHLLGGLEGTWFAGRAAADLVLE